MCIKCKYHWMKKPLEKRRYITFLFRLFIQLHSISWRIKFPFLKPFINNMLSNATKTSANQASAAIITANHSFVCYENTAILFDTLISNFQQEALRAVFSSNCIPSASRLSARHFGNRLYILSNASSQQVQISLDVKYFRVLCLGTHNDIL